MVTKLEQVARALCALDVADLDGDKESLAETNWYTNADNYIAEARTVIQALMEPSEGMLRASRHALREMTREEYMAMELASRDDAHDHKAKARLRAMLQHILEDTD